MSWELVEEVYEHSQTRGAARGVLAALAHYAGSEGRVADPSVATLVKASGYGRSTVLEQLPKIEATGEIERIGSGRGRGNNAAYLIADLAGEGRVPKRPRQPPLMGSVKRPAPGPIAENTSEKGPEKVQLSADVNLTVKKEEGRKPPQTPRGGRRRDRELFERELQLYLEQLQPCPAEIVAKWSGVLADCSSAIDVGAAQIWLTPMHLAGVDEDGLLVLLSRDPNWVRDRFGKLLEASAATAGVRYEILLDLGRGSEIRPAASG